MQHFKVTDAERDHRLYDTYEWFVGFGFGLMTLRCIFLPFRFYRDWFVCQFIGVYIIPSNVLLAIHIKLKIDYYQVYYCLSS